MKFIFPKKLTASFLYTWCHVISTKMWEKILRSTVDSKMLWNQDLDGSKIALKIIHIGKVMPRRLNTFVPILSTKLANPNFLQLVLPHSLLNIRIVLQVNPDIKWCHISDNSNDNSCLFLKKVFSKNYPHQPYLTVTTQKLM